MATITIEELYRKLNEQLNAADNLDSFYIGKTIDVDRRAKEHLKEDNLQNTIQLAFGDENTIVRAEKYLQEMFMNNPKCINKQKGGGPNVTSDDKLYISFRNKALLIKSIHDLDYDEFKWETTYELI